jgi:hypothetical protein
MPFELPPFIAGLVGGVIAWFVTQFIAEPLRRFFGMRREIAQYLLDYGNVRARGEDGQELTEQDKARLRDAQKKIRELATQTLSFAQTDALAANLLRWLWRYDLMRAGTALLMLSHELAIGTQDERQLAVKSIYKALRIKDLP